MVRRLALLVFWVRRAIARLKVHDRTGSPADSLKPWRLSEDEAALFHRVLDRDSPVGKPALKAGAARTEGGR